MDKKFSVGAPYHIHGAVDIFDELRGLGHLCSTHWQHLGLGVEV
jgi:hypothetical protein